VRHFFSQAYVTCLLAKGSDKVDILDRKDFAGGLVSDIEESLRFIERNTRTGYRIEKLRREDVPEYPMRALREAITNAVMHRDTGTTLKQEQMFSLKSMTTVSKSATLEDCQRG